MAKRTGSTGGSDSSAPVAAAAEAAEMGDELTTAMPDKIPTKEVSGSGLTDEVKLDAWDDVASLRAAEGEDKVNLDEGSDIQQNFSGIVATRTREELRDVGSSGSSSSAATTTVRDLEQSRYSGPATDYDKVDQFELPSKEFGQGDKSFKVVDVKETPLQGRATFNKDTGLIEYKSGLKENPAAFREDVKGLLEGTVPYWDEMGDEQRTKMYDSIMSKAKNPQKPTKAEAQAALNDIRKRFPETGGSDYSQWKMPGSDEIIYDLEQGPGSYDPTTGQPVGGRFEDRSDVKNLRRRFEAMPGLEAEEIDEAMAFYETYRQEKDAAKRWNISHNTESPAKLLEAKREEEATPSYDAEGNPRRATKKRSEQKRLIESWENNFSGDVGVADVPKQAERHKEAAKGDWTTFLHDPHVGQYLAAESQLEVADEASTRSAARVAAAPGYATATAKVADVQAKQEVAADTVQDQVDAAISADLKSGESSAKAKLTSDRSATKDQFGKLPVESFGGKDATEQAARKAMFGQLLDQIQKAPSAVEFDRAKARWDAAVANLPAKYAADLNTAFSTERASLETFSTAQGALKEADATARAAIMATPDGQSLAALDAELATAKAERDASRKGLYERDVTALDAAGGDEAKTKAALKTISTENEELKELIDEMRTTRDRLAAETDYDKKEKEYQDKIGAYNALLTAAEQGDPQGVNAAWERLSGEKFPKELTTANVTTEGFNAQTKRAEAEKAAIDAEAAKKRAASDAKTKKFQDDLKAGSDAMGGVIEYGTKIGEGFDAVKNVQTAIDGITRREETAQRMTEINGKLMEFMSGTLTAITGRTSDTIAQGFTSLKEAATPKKAEQTATQKAAHDRAYDTETRTTQLENRASAMSLSDEIETKESTVEKTEAERDKLQEEARKIQMRTDMRRLL